MTLELHSEDAVVCKCDRVRAEQIIWNLTTNACKFTSKGGTVRLSLVSEGGFVKVSVADTGRGIAAEFLPSIFDMFNQADVQLSPSNGGLGIGLALVRELVQAHGGRVEALSDGVGQGSEFTVWMPLNVSNLAVSDAALPTTEFVRGLRILSVDDDVESLTSFAALLRLEGATVDTAISAALALDLMARHEYDVLISDISMPDMDGYALIAQVHRDWPNSTLRSIALSGFGREIDKENARAAGFDAHLAKPAAMDDVKRVLAALKIARPISGTVE